MAIDVAGHQRADPYVRGHLGHGGQQGPRLEDVARAGASHGNEVVEEPEAVEATLVGGPPELTELVDRGVLLGGFQADGQFRHALIS